MTNFTPTFKLLVNDKDITEHLQKNLISLSFKDAAGIISDEITLEVAEEFKHPKYQDKLKLWLGYKESGIWYCGCFAVQTSERALHKTTIAATGVDFSGSLKARKNRAWEKVGLKEIVEKIAKEHGLSYKTDFKEIKILYAAQHYKSDLAFLKELAKEKVAIFSIKDNKILF